MFTFGQCKHFCDPTNPDWFPANARKLKVQKAYDKDTQKIKSSGLSLEDYIIQNVMTRHGVKLDLVITFNKYPYYVDCDHLLYWFKDGFVNKAEEQIKSLFKTQEYCYSQAPEQFRSIPGIGHFHIFVKK